MQNNDLFYSPNDCFIHIHDNAKWFSVQYQLKLHISSLELMIMYLYQYIARTGVLLFSYLVYVSMC